MNDLLETGRRFATALDTENYAALQALLSKDCEYITPKGTLIGPKAIIAAYGATAEWARSTIQDVRYRSDVRTGEEGELVITFIDRLRHKGLEHIYRCEQAIRLNVAGRVCRIEHRELRGQREAVDRFLEGLNKGQRQER